MNTSRVFLSGTAGALALNGVHEAALRTDKTSAYWKRALLFGGAIGVGVATLPPIVGLDNQKTRKPAITAALTTAWYITGALATAAIASLLDQKKSKR